MSELGKNLHAIKGMILVLMLGSLLTQNLNVTDELLALADELILRMPFKILAEVFPDTLQELDLFDVAIVFPGNGLLFFFELFFQAFKDRHKIFFNKILFLLHVEVQSLHLEFDLIAILPVIFDFVVEAGELVEDLSFMDLIDFVKMSDVVSAVLLYVDVLPSSQTFHNLNKQPHDNPHSSTAFIFDVMYIFI